MAMMNGPRRRGVVYSLAAKGPLRSRSISSINAKKAESSRMNISALEQHVLLAIVALHPDAYGVSIQSHIKRRAGYEPSIGSTYAALDRLEDKGFVRSHQGEKTPERGGRRKLHFTVTAPGEATLRESLRAISSLQRGLRWGTALSQIGGTA
jgi:PadR family transcriptional regulator PadR